MAWQAALALALLCSGIHALERPADYADFTGDKVLRFTPTTQEQMAKLRVLRDRWTVPLGLDWWRDLGLVNHTCDLRVPPSAMANVSHVLHDAGIVPTVMIEDLQAVIDAQLKDLRPANESAGFDLSQYHDLSEISAYLRSLPQLYPSLVTLFDVGNSYQGRLMQGVKITGQAGGTKPGFWMDGGIHAREWIASATVLYMMTQLLELYGTDAGITALVDAYDIYVLPVFNVDGYAYTWTSNRMWRKTRSPSPGSSCIGADPNRNFAFHWGEIGASADPCDETYRGAAPFSEIEAKQVADFIQGNGDIVAYFNIHSYSQLWLIPWGYTDAQTRDYALQMDLSKKATDALTMVHGTRYVYGPTYYTVYPTSGGSRDWTYGALNMVHSYGIELRDTGEYGFLLPADQIVPTGEETFAAMRVAMQYILAA